ncbi:MAG: hypothetical protein AMXMBFR77_28000 [Phycisphaerales bacterium]
MSYFLSRYGQATIIEESGGHAQINLSAGQVLQDATFEFSPKLEVFMRDEALRGAPGALLPLTAAFYGSTVTVKKPLYRWSETLPTGNPTESPDALILKQAFGAAVSSGYQAAALDKAESDKVTIALKAGKDRTLYKAGGGIIVHNGTSYAIAPIHTVVDDDPDTVNLLLPLPWDPSAGDDATTIYGVRTLSLSKGTRTSFTLHYQGEGAAMALYFVGALLESLKGTLDPMGVMQIEATFRVTHVQLDNSGVAITAPYEYTTSPLPVAMGSYGARLIRGTAIPTTPAELDVHALSFEVALAHSPVRGHGPSYGVRDVRVDPKFSMTYTKVLNAAPDIGLNDNSNRYPLWFCAGNQPGAMFGLCVPKPTVVEIPGYTNVEGLWAQTYKVEAGFQTTDAPSTDTPANSGARAYLG